MRYAYNEVGDLINGIIFFFQNGDAEIATATFEVINASEQRPTGIVWNGFSPTPQETLSKLYEQGALSTGFLGVMFTVDEDRLLREVLEFLREDYPLLLPLVEEVDSRVFGTRH